MLYKVFANSKEIAVNPVTVSALPLNKLWDGIQRPLSQTEEAYYCTLDIENGTDIEILTDTDFESYELRPLNLTDKSQRCGRSVKIKIEKPCQFTFEVDGFHNALHIFVNPRDEKPVGKVRYFSKGDHKAGLIWLESNETLYLEEGAVVYGAVYGKDVRNVKICGRGVIDSSPYKRGNDFTAGGQEIREALAEKGFSEDNLKYIGNLVLQNCKNVTVEGVILKDSPLWSVIVRDNCEDIVIDNIKIIGQWRYNSDGIDICTSKNVTVKNCFIRSFDDCIVARGAYLPEEEGNVENLLVENNVCWCDWGIALEVWCGHKETTVKNVCFKNNYIIRISRTVMDIQTWYGSRNTLIENISFDGVFIDGDKEYRNLTIESAENLGYREEKGFVPNMLRIIAPKIGKMLGQGTQLCEAVSDYSDYNLLYRNIEFKNVKYSGIPLKVEIKPVKNLLKIENVTADNCDFEIKA